MTKKLKHPTPRQLAEEIYKYAYGRIGEANLDRVGRLVSGPALKFASEVWKESAKMMKGGRG